jgi:hypothetical protein
MYPDQQKATLKPIIMQHATFSFKLTAKSSLARVFFFPEHETNSVHLTSDDGKVWKNKGFALEVEDPFEYKLRVYGATGTKWEADLNLVIDGTERTFISWNGTTGDTATNVSERTVPVKNLPNTVV